MTQFRKISIDIARDQNVKTVPRKQRVYPKNSDGSLDRKTHREWVVTSRVFLLQFLRLEYAVQRGDDEDDR